MSVTYIRDLYSFQFTKINSSHYSHITEACYVRVKYYGSKKKPRSLLQNSNFCRDESCIQFDFDRWSLIWLTPGLCFWAADLMDGRTATPNKNTIVTIIISTKNQFESQFKEYKLHTSHKVSIRVIYLGVIYSKF